MNRVACRPLRLHLRSMSVRFPPGWSIPLVAALLSLTDAGAVTLQIRVEDDAGRVTPAAVQLYDDHGTLHVPPDALDLGHMGYLYATGALIHYADWTSPKVRSQYPHFGSSWFRARHPKDAACFFTPGRFALEVAPGRYRLRVTKGPEFTPVERTIVIDDSAVSQTVTLARWINMAAKGWISGDGHVHIQRDSPAANETALAWARAEDLRICHVLLMGDAKDTYYPQYGYGDVGRATSEQTILLSGQEDPRTRHLGHTLHLNTAGMLRDAGHYYNYAPVFARNRGTGISGFAHVGRRRWSFQVERGLTLLAPTGMLDFAEIAQMGYVGVNLWHEFLNLGFRLTAMGGSDVPWGGSIGSTRVYAHTGGEIDSERWIAAVRAGRTFVTTGPMLECTVNGHLPGSVLSLRRGERVRVVARAQRESSFSTPWRLKVVALGETIREVSGTGALTAEVDLPAAHSMWVNVQCETNPEELMDGPGFFAGAVTTPVFIEVDGRPARDERRLAELVARRLRCLDEIEAWLSVGTTTMERGGPGGWESPAALDASAAALRAQVRAARDYFQNLPTRR